MHGEAVREGGDGKGEIEGNGEGREDGEGEGEE